MSFWSRLWGGEKAAEKLIDGVSNGLDKLWYTDEEKAEDMAKSASEARAMVIEWMRATSGQNLARRFLAISFTMMWGGIYGLSAILTAYAPWSTHQEKIMQSADALFKASESLNGAAMLILGFYFAAPHMTQIASKAMEKFSK